MAAKDLILETVPKVEFRISTDSANVAETRALVDLGWIQQGDFLNKSFSSADAIRCLQRDLMVVCNVSCIGDVESFNIRVSTSSFITPEMTNFVRASALLEPHAENRQFSDDHVVKIARIIRFAQNEALKSEDESTSSSFEEEEKPEKKKRSRSHRKEKSKKSKNGAESDD